MSEKVNKKKDEIVIINKFKESNAEDVRTSISKIFEMFCNLKLSK
jgi:hypothetical protein